MLQRYLIVWLVLLSGLAYQWPNLGPLAQWGDPFVASKPALFWLIVVTMFAIGLMLPRDEVRQVAQRWPAVLGGTAIQFVSMPLLAYTMGRLFGFVGNELIGMVLVGCVPGAMASNVLTLNARGNASYSVSLTTLATLLSPLATPLLLGLYLSREEAVDGRLLLDACYTLLKTVVIPVTVGYAVSRATSRWENIYRRVGPIVANVAILLVIAIIVGLERENLAQLTLRLIAALFVVNVLGYLAGYGGGRLMRLPWPMRRALTLEVGMQNAGLGAFLATRLFADSPGAAVAPTLYMFGCMLTGVVLAQFWSRFGGGEATSDGKSPGTA